MLFIPCQDGRFFDFENFHMTDTWSPWLEAGEVMVFSIDTIDQETWSDTDGDPYWRIRVTNSGFSILQMRWFLLCGEIVNERNGWTGYPGIMVFGCSLGATHAANLYFRRPDLFDRLLALSGLYSAGYGFGSCTDEVVRRNSLVDFLGDMPKDDPRIALYNLKKAVILRRSGTMGTSGLHEAARTDPGREGYPCLGGFLGL